MEARGTNIISSIKKSMSTRYSHFIWCYVVFVKIDILLKNSQESIKYFILFKLQVENMTVAKVEKQGDIYFYEFNFS